MDERIMGIEHIWILLWIAVFVIGFKVNCTEMLGNKGINVIRGEYYRFFTGLLVHAGWFHLMINVVSIYFVVGFLKEQVDTIKLLVFSAVVATITNIIFSLMYKESTSIGGSPVVFAMLGLLIVLQIMDKNVERFVLDSLQTKWILGYAILGNIPIFSKNISTFVIHFIAFVIAAILGCIVVKVRII